MQDLTFAPEPLQSQGRTLTEHVFKQIQTAIVLGQIPAGSKISEPELARTYGISRGPLREAIHRLEGQRLVERTAHVGARVVSLSLQQFKELYQIRASLEGLACKLAAQHIDKSKSWHYVMYCVCMLKMKTLKQVKDITCKKGRTIFTTALLKVVAIKP